MAPMPHLQALESLCRSIHATMDVPAQTVEQLQTELTDLHDQSAALMSTADAAYRDLTAAESTQFDELQGRFDGVQRQITRLDALEAQRTTLATPTGRETEPAEGDHSDEATTPAVAPPIAHRRAQLLPATVRDTGRQGFRNLGEFAIRVRMATLAPSDLDPRLRAIMAPTTAGTEGVGADGGFAVPPDFRTAIQELITSEQSLFSRCDQVRSASNFFTIPKDSTTPWQSSGGILAFWDGENQAIAQSKPSLEVDTIPLNKLTALVPITDELAEDAPGLDSYLRRKAPAKMRFKADLAIVQGTGVGQPLGIINSPALVSVAKESAQAADTIVFENIVTMWARLYGESRFGAVWLINQDIESQLTTLEFTGTNSSTPAYLPANGLAGSPFGTLLGRPVIPTQACETLGDLGDIILADLSQYLLIQRATGIQADTSIHLWFDYATTAFRFIWRVGGRPWWGAAASPRSGTATMSPFVALAERA